MNEADPTAADDISAYPTGHNAPLRATATAMARVPGARSLILVEGVSDQIALETLAGRLDIDLVANDVVIVPIGGATAIGGFVANLHDNTAHLVGVCDVAERKFYELALRPSESSHDLFVCDIDLEDELVRAVGRERVEHVLRSAGDLGKFRTLQKQAEWSDQPFEAQLRRWFGAGARRKSRYAQLLILAADHDQLPLPLVDALRASIA